MRKLFFHIFLFVAAWHTGHAQAPTQKEILRSGKYYYHISYDSDSLRARQTALRGLMSKVANDKRTESFAGKSGKIFLEKVKYFQLKLIEQYKVIAYIDKNDIHHPKQLSMAEITTPKKDSTRQSPTKPQKVHLKDSLIKRAHLNPLPGKELHPRPQIDNPIIKDLAGSSNTKELIEKIKKYRNEGRLQVVTNTRKYSQMYGDKDFYKIILDKNDKSIKALLDKNSDRDLRTGKIIGKDEQNQNIQLWLKTL